MDEPPEAKVADDGPADLDDLLLGVVLEEVIEHRLIDVVVVDEQALGVTEGGLLGLGEVLVSPAADLRYGCLVEAFPFR